MSEKDTREQDLASKKMKRTLSLEDPKKCRKKKQKLKKRKKEKLNKKKLKTKGECCDSFTQMDEIKKKKKKKKNDVTLPEDYPLPMTQHKKSNLSKRHKQNKGKNHAEEAHKFETLVKRDEHEPTNPALEEQHERSALRENVRNRRTVMFKLSPEEILTMSQQNHSQPYSTDKSHSLYTVFSGNRRHNRLSFGENGAEFQSTPEYIDSQDLFITQKFFSEPQEDISRSPSTDEDIAVPPYQNSIQYRQATQETPSCKQTAEASVQTENFFTSPGLASSLKFLQSTASICTEKPMDLSLPKRTRHEVCLDQCVSKPVEHQSRLEPKITDLTSSDESDIQTSKSRADLSHLKVVQTRLNESFFFRVKGEGDSPKARSPLMMLTGNADKKLKK